MGDGSRITAIFDATLRALSADDDDVADDGDGSLR